MLPSVLTRLTIDMEIGQHPVQYIDGSLAGEIHDTSTFTCSQMDSSSGDGRSA